MIKNGDVVVLTKVGFTYGKRPVGVISGVYKTDVGVFYDVSSDGKVYRNLSKFDFVSKKKYDENSIVSE
jgi:hypothetical protein